MPGQVTTVATDGRWASGSFEEFVDQSQRRLFRFAVVLSGDPSLAEDLVADVLGRAYERWPRVSTADNPYAYVRRMVVNAFVDWTRRRSRAVPRADLHDLVDGAYADTPDHATVHSERTALAAQLARLPRQQRAAIVLHVYEGLSHAEVAKVLGCRVPTARGYLSRGLAALRITVKEDF